MLYIYDYSFILLNGMDVILDKKDFDTFDRDDDYYKNNDLNIILKSLFSKTSILYISSLVLTK